MLTKIDSALSPEALAELLGGKVIGHDTNNDNISSITCDSREVVAGSAFVAYSGQEADGCKFIDSAIVNGAKCIITDQENVVDRNFSVPCIIVPDARYAFSHLTATATNNPTKELITVGITGTNGKTTTLWLVSELLEKFGHSTLRIGTLGVSHRNNILLTVEMTTPPADQIHLAAKDALKEGATAFVMEVSSHGLHQHRTAHVFFNAVAFTNLTHDHLHYHRDMEDYFQMKKRLFEQALANDINTPCIIGIDDIEGYENYALRLKSWCQDQGAKTITYGLNSSADLVLKSVDYSIGGTTAELIFQGKEFKFHSPLIGHYNTLNCLAAAAIVMSLGYDLEIILQHLATIKAPIGRMERFHHKGSNVFVDYAHTPDGLSKALSALRPLTKGQLWLMFGIGGSKDPYRRTSMGKIAMEMADHTVLTADNPKTVPLKDINKDIMSCGLKPILIEDDRATAIHKTVALLKEGDVLLIAGKGQENYQIVGTDTFSYSDQEEVMKAFTMIKGH